MVCDGGEAFTLARVGEIRKENESVLGRFDSTKGIVSDSFFDFGLRGRLALKLCIPAM